MVKEPVADVGESSSGSLETGDRWKKSVGQIDSTCGEDESINDAFMGNYSQGINLHRAWEENRLLGEAELLGCSPDGDVNPVSPRVDTVDSPKIASKNLINTKWADIVTKGPGDPSQPALSLNPDQNVIISDLGGDSASSRTLPSWAETIDKLNSTEAESHDLLNIPLANEEEQSENSDCSLPCSTNEWKKASLGFLTAVLLAKVAGFRVAATLTETVPGWCSATSSLIQKEQTRI
ncbi:hypothetical protein V6N11_061913 [Hibiscus sabdariffa]|uniref:Uncharacterized protein n=1 Tax=Hibiscus sabdariffa TaxID=183260 RepID=A0ABR2N7R0_9ROSI